MKKFIDWYYGWSYQWPGICGYVTFFVFVLVMVLSVLFLISHFQLTGTARDILVASVSFFGGVGALNFTSALQKRAYQKIVSKKVYKALSVLVKEE